MYYFFFHCFCVFLKSSASIGITFTRLNILSILCFILPLNASVGFGLLLHMNSGTLFCDLPRKIGSTERAKRSLAPSDIYLLSNSSIAKKSTFINSFLTKYLSSYGASINAFTISLSVVYRQE